MDNITIFSPVYRLLQLDDVKVFRRNLGGKMEQSKIDRINAFARRVKPGETLTDAELAERAALREEYLAQFRAVTRQTLESTVLQRPDGSRESLRRKD